MRKRVFRHMQTAKAQISLRFCADRLGSSLSGNKIILDYRKYQSKAILWIRLCPCVGRIWIYAFGACSKTLFRLARPIYNQMYNQMRNTWLLFMYAQWRLLAVCWHCTPSNVFWTSVVKGNRHNFRGDNSVKMFWLPFENGVYPKRKVFAPFEAYFSLLE